MENIKVRSLNADDTKQIKLIDELSGNGVANMADCKDYAWGLFKGDNLIAYCTIGGADDTDMGYDEYPEWTDESKLLSDVFVREEYRRQGYALKMLNEVLKEANPEKQAVFITLINNNLSRLYEKLGFRLIDDGTMVNNTRLNSLAYVQQTFND